MKILFIQPMTGAARGGSQVNTSNLALALAQRGHKVAVIGDFSLVPSLKTSLVEADIRLYEENTHQKGLSSIVLIRKIINTERPDVVMSPQRSGDIRLAFASLLFPTLKISIVNEKLPVQFSIHVPQDYLKSLVHRVILRYCFDGWVAISEFVREHLMCFAKVQRRNIEVIRNPVDTNLYVPLKPNQGSPGTRAKPMIGCVGRLSPIKHPELFLEFVKHMLQMNYTGQFSFIGDGVMRKELESEVRARGLENRILFLGAQTNMVQAYNNLDILVHFCDVEAFGLAVAEAMSCCIPVVGFNSGGLSELVINNETGFLLPTNDIAGMADTVLRLLKDTALRNRIGQQAREAIQSMCQPSSIAGQYESYFGRVASACSYQPR